jgi:hypothetical protein
LLTKVIIPERGRSILIDAMQEELGIGCPRQIGLPIISHAKKVGTAAT